MALRDDINADLAAHHFNTDDFARTVTYNGSDISALVDFGMYDDTGENACTARLIVKASDVAAPAYRDTVVISGTSWRVFRDPDREVAVKGDGHVWELALIRDERPTW